MDFINRNVQPQASAAAPEAHGPSATRHSTNSNNKPDNSMWTRVGIIVCLFAVVVLVVALIVSIATTNNSNSTDQGESSYVYTDKLQAVFLNTGQVYFGNIKVLNDKYLVLTDIYYLQTSSSGSSSSSTSANSSVSLVKLGCELHRPYDEMVINRAQVTFWENLQSDGQVASAVATFQKENPNGQKCSDQSASSSTTSGASAQSASPNTTTPSTSTSGQ